MIPVGPITLVLLLLLAGFGFLDGVLDRMGLTVRQAVGALLAMLLGSPFTVSLAPDLRFNFGTGLVPMAAALALMARGGRQEMGETAWSALATATGVYVLGRWFPPGRPTELNLFYLDAQYLFAVMAALVACATGRASRGVFCAAVLGVMLADLVQFVAKRLGVGEAGLIQFGGGPLWATGVVAGALAVLLAELLDQDRESVRHPARGQRTGPIS